MTKTLAVLVMFALSVMASAQTSSHSVSLTCTPPTIGGQASGFNFYRGTVAGGPYTLQNSAPVSGCTFTDAASLVEGTKYFYVATSTGPGGESVASNEATALIPFSKPSPPTLLVASPK
jgi:hypothetical protein